MTGKQRAYLRGMAAKMPAIFQIGKGGISDQMVEQISNALEARELIKLRVLENSACSPVEAADILAVRTGAETVAVTGSKFVLYRESEKHKKIDLSAAR